MIEIIHADRRFDFASQYKWTSVLSLVVVAAALALIIRGPNYGVDFTGGAEVLVALEEEIPMEQLRDAIEREGFSGFNVQRFGEKERHSYLVKLPATEKNLNEVTQKLSGLLTRQYAAQGARIDKVDIVGPKAGEQLRISGLQAMLWALVAIMVYIGLRFDFRYSPGAIAALFHDVVIIVGIFSLLQLEFTLQIVAALLAIIGYSVNDTVVIYDRVREHEQSFAGRSLEEHINNAASETLSRTFLTSGTTLFISLAMYSFGGESIQNFFLAISLGVVIGTYSSLFVAAPVTLFFERLKQRKEGTAATSRP